jgi:hypothetical protein
LFSWRRLVLLGVTAPALTFLLWSCNSHPLQTPKPAPVGESAQYREINPISAVDIVFVVDNSGSMSQEQANLARNFPVFMQELALLQGGDFRVAVVNTDLGGGAATMNGECAPTTPGGDRGLFCHVRGVDKCGMCGVDTSQGRFLRTINPNYQGAPATLPSVFTCLATMGTSGCSFEHSIGALRNSLTLPENGQFVRPDAYLAFVLITDEEDCTAPPDSQLFANPDPAGDWSLRCYTEAVVCNGAHPSAAASNFALNECQVATDGQLTPVNQLVQDILAVKNNDPTLIIAAGIFGWPLPGQEAAARHRISGGGQGGTFTMQPVCQSGNGSATPGYRVKSFVESFPNHATYSICQDDFRDAMRRLGEKIRATVGPPCVDAPLVDIDANTAGLQVDCSVTEKIKLDGGGVDERVLPACTPGFNGVCWSLVANAQCTGSGQLVDIERRDGSMPVVGTQQSIRCLTRVN